MMTGERIAVKKQHQRRCEKAQQIEVVVTADREITDRWPEPTARHMGWLHAKGSSTAPCSAIPDCLGFSVRETRVRGSIRSVIRRDTTKSGLLADGVGFEPTKDLRPCRISSPVHSTALPPIPLRASQFSS